MIIDIIKENANLVLDEKEDCVIDFWNETCPKCLTLKETVIPEIEKKYGKKLKIYLVNCGSTRKVSVKYKVMSLPAFVFLKKGIQIAKLTPTKSVRENIIKIIEENY